MVAQSRIFTPLTGILVMYPLILFDDFLIRKSLLPFTFTRPVADIRVGIQTIAQKWRAWSEEPVGYLTQEYLMAKFPVTQAADALYVNGAVCPTADLIDALNALQPGHGMLDSSGLLLGIRHAQLADNEIDIRELVNGQRNLGLPSNHRIRYDKPLTIIRQLTDIFACNGEQIRADYARITHNRSSQPLTDPFTRCYASDAIFLEEGATVRASVLNAEGGPIYIGRNAVVQEGAVVLGPFALGEGATVNWGSKMRTNTSIGPYCKVGGEVGNSVFFGYSNKSHDGFLGNSVVGEWCNFGAATNNSNLKNDYSPVKLHSYATGQLEDTGRQFCGLMMGDYTKTGIGTLFNTGTVVGVNVNVFGAGFQPKHIPSFLWGGAAEGFTEYRIEKALAVARETMLRRGITLTDTDEAILRTVSQQTESIVPMP
jgi:UDP-N-acetylglucosamine diphosphorylase / glucose-1-phosphate thymidylyltransferase / UDP-N-acetylgalactosamine diphosphorylase / glucosamine-1-phosphate N-acetyltransferase / galactosamine-1-phosphate N-acetyltransferase